MPTADKVLFELEQIAGTDQVRKDLDLPLFEDGVLDSLGAVQLMVALAEAFGIGISPAEIDRSTWATPRKIIGYMEQRVGTLA